MMRKLNSNVGEARVLYRTLVAKVAENMFKISAIVEMRP